MTLIIQQQLWGYKVEEKLNLGVLGQLRLNITVLHNRLTDGGQVLNLARGLHFIPHEYFSY
jgi:hypothetical protein